MVSHQTAKDHMPHNITQPSCCIETVALRHSAREEREACLVTSTRGILECGDHDVTLIRG